MNKDKKINAEQKDQVEKVKAIKKSTYSKKKEGKKKYFKRNSLCSINI